MLDYDFRGDSFPVTTAKKRNLPDDGFDIPDGGFDIPEDDDAIPADPAGVDNLQPSKRMILIELHWLSGHKTTCTLPHPVFIHDVKAQVKVHYNTMHKHQRLFAAQSEQPWLMGDETLADFVARTSNVPSTTVSNVCLNIIHLQFIECAALLCKKNSQEPNVKFKFCPGCRNFAYCSKQCFKADWTMLHKHNCKRSHDNSSGELCSDESEDSTMMDEEMGLPALAHDC